jgi:tetratricopeptide (TPR) repeat protein
MALESQKKYAEILDVLGGDPEHSVTHPLISLANVEMSDVLRPFRRLAEFNLNRTDGRILRTPASQTELSDSLSSYRIEEDIIKGLMNKDPSRLQKYTRMCDKTSERDALLLTACGCWRYLISNGSSDTCIGFLLKAVEEDPDCEISWLSLIFVYIDTLELDQGIVAVKTAQRRFPSSTRLPLFALSLDLRRGVTSFARTWLRLCDSTDPYVLHEKGVFLIMEGEFAEAAEYFRILTSEKKLDTNLEGPGFLNYAHCLRLQGKFDLALEMYFASLKKLRNVAEALGSIGFTFHLMGDLEKAVLYYNRCLGMNSSHPFVTRMVERALLSVR